MPTYESDHLPWKSLILVQMMGGGGRQSFLSLNQMPNSIDQVHGWHRLGVEAGGDRKLL